MKYLPQIETHLRDKAQNITMGMSYVCMYLYMHVYIVMWIYFSMHQKSANLNLVNV